MVVASIVINQIGKPAGVPSQSRDDLDINVLVTLTNNDDTGVVTWLWEFVSKPVGSAAVLIDSTLPTASFTPDVRGSYLIKLTVNATLATEASDTRIGAIKTSYLSIRKPATSEKKEFDSTDGWSAALQAMIDAVDGYASLSLQTDGYNPPIADIGWDGYKIINLGGMENEGVLRLGETTDPAAVSDKGFIYAKDDAGDTELFWRDDSGAIVQITKDGQLDVIGVRETSGPTFLTFGSVPDGQLLIRSGSNIIGAVPSSGGLVKIRVDDLVDGYLHSKLLTGPGLNFAIANPGGNETLTIDAYGELKVRSDDTTFGYLHEKLLTGSGLNFSISSPGGNETLTIDAYGELKVSSNDTTFGYLEDKLVIGAGVILTTLNEGVNETRRIDAYGTKVSVGDTHIGFLNGKLLAGSNVTLTKLNAGGNESLQVSTPDNNTLGQAYNQGGSAAGRTITTVSGLPVLITNSGNETLATDGYLGISEIGASPTTLYNKGLLYTKDVSGITELFYLGYGGAELQLSKNGSLLVSLDQAYNFGGSGSGRTITILATKPVQLSGSNIETLTTDGYFGLSEMSSDPSPLRNKGLIYTQDDGYGTTALYYMDQSGDKSLIALDGYAGALSYYDELSPAVTTGAETSLFLSHKPRNPASLRMYRNGILMRRVSSLGVSLTEYVWNLDRLITFRPTLLAGDWYAANYLYNK